MNTIDLTKKLISIPSYVNSETNERGISEFIIKYCSDLKWLRVTKQVIQQNRCNILISDGFPTKLLFLGHLDTVQPTLSGQTRPYIKNNCLFGLGASDMKNNIAAFLNAWRSVGMTKGI